ncbi:YcgN family cysteine cluster protein [Desulfococcaceae bacterium HSG8]|nr:YcgN family cysteine cluster protein [Desulfococcaceae bacterium HSG8]
MMPEPFWKAKSFTEMTHEEWESLCDGCGRCCLQKLEDKNTGEIYYTNVACRLLNIRTCRCMRYPKRTQSVSNCKSLTPDTINQFYWLPDTCAYRLIARGQELAWWHPLISGDKNTVREAGISIADGLVPVVSELFVSQDQLKDHIVDWKFWPPCSDRSRFA